MASQASPEPRAPAAELADARRRLGDMVHRVLGDVPISHSPPGGGVATERAVGLYVYEIRPATAPAKLPLALQFNARFLVTAHGPDPAAAAEDLAELAFAALGEPEVDVDIAPLPAGVWSAFGSPPRPSFTISLVVRRIRQARPTRLVRETILQLRKK